MPNDNLAGDLHGDHPARDALGVPSSATTTRTIVQRLRDDAVNFNVPAPPVANRHIQRTDLTLAVAVKSLHQTKEKHV